MSNQKKKTMENTEYMVDLDEDKAIQKSKVWKERGAIYHFFPNA